MGINKAVGPDEIPIEAWRCLGGEEVRWLTILFNKTLSRAKMPEEWRLSEQRESLAVILVSSHGAKMANGARLHGSRQWSSRRG
ncbi:hypothetical protein Tco_1279096 [Tanacetum coccineum]